MLVIQQQSIQSFFLNIYLCLLKKYFLSNISYINTCFYNILPVILLPFIIWLTLFHRSLSLPGAYRRMLIKPGTVDWKLYRYKDVNIELALSDLDKLQNKPEPVSEEGTSNSTRGFTFSCQRRGMQSFWLKKMWTQGRTCLITHY